MSPEMCFEVGRLGVDLLTPLVLALMYPPFLLLLLVLG